MVPITDLRHADDRRLPVRVRGFGDDRVVTRRLPLAACANRRGVGVGPEFLGAFRSAPSSNREGSFVQDGLAAGQRFGLISSSDHGNGASYAAVLAERLDRDSLIDCIGTGKECKG